MALIGVALIFGLVNAALKSGLIVLSCPLVVLTFFVLIINGILPSSKSPWTRPNCKL